MDAGISKGNLRVCDEDAIQLSQGKAARQALPIGNDDFRDTREGNFYYVDKTMLIKDFIEMQDKVALITRQRRFGKTLSMTMIRDFFDITQESSTIFRGLKIMDSEYACRINTKPVIYFWVCV